MRKLILFKTVFIRDWIEMKRYPFNFASWIITIYIIFLAIFLGYKAVGGSQPNFVTNLDGIIVGFMMWTFSISAYSTLAWEMMNEAKMGTLEQLYMTPLGFNTFCIFKIISSFFLNLLFIVPILLLMMVTTGRYLHINLLTFIPLLILTISGVYGVGFITGGLGLVFKQVQSLFQVLQFIFIGFIAAPIGKLPVLKLLPLSLGSHMMRKAMVNNSSLFQIGLQNFTYLVLNSIFYFGAGLLIFVYCQKVARNRGLLGHY